MAKYLLIVESPSKAKTIKKYLGKEWDVVSSMGHIEDLPEKKLGIDIKNDFKPTYQIIPGKNKLISELKKLVKKYEKVYLGTDEDREGEAIAWHLQRVLNLPQDTPRITFNEITKSALKKAVENPRTIDRNLVNAQQGRRILDRLVGYKISPVLWKKIQKGLSGGRVQSVAVKLVVERENEIKNFIPQSKWQIQVSLENKDKNIKLEAKLEKISDKNIEISSEEEILNLLKQLGFTNKISQEIKKEKLSDYHEVETKTLKIRQKKEFKLIDIENKKSKKSAPAPFITSTLQQQASSTFGWGVRQVMQIAQKLYENGYITYMRTDSPTLSQEALKSIGNYISSNFGKEYLDLKQYKSKSKSAQEAHEAIRPTDISKSASDLKLSGMEAKLYDLIRKRTLQSQMADAIYDIQTLKFQINDDLKDIWVSKFEKLQFPGWKILDKKQSKQEHLDLQKNEIFYSKQLIAKQNWTKPPARYTESSLVKKLESLGIGRPSTYAPTIYLIQKRGYVEKTSDKKLKPTDIGILVTQYLDKNFPELMDYGFTAQMETKLDEIAKGNLKYTKMLKDFWEGFERYLKQAESTEKVNNYTGSKCPKCGGSLVYKYSKFGKFIACENYPKCDYKDKTDEEKSYLQSLKEKYEGKPCPEGGTIVVKVGKYGPFLTSSDYPKVKWIKSIREYELDNLTEKFGGEVCDKCGKGKMVVKSSKRGYFLACSRYPDCKNTKKLNINKDK